MHEMGIASSVLEAVDKETHRNPGCRAMKVGLRIGEYAAVDQDSLRFAFEVLAKDANQVPLELEIDFRSGCDDLAIAFIEFDDSGSAPFADAHGSAGGIKEATV
jgi:hypothetical protein